jgi:hypothetical protein
MRTLLGVSIVLFTLVTFTDAIAESEIDRAAKMAQPASDMIWFHDDFWTNPRWEDPALTDKPILKTSTASVPVQYDEAKVIKAQEYLKAVSKEIDANMLWSDNAEFERNRF